MIVVAYFNYDTGRSDIEKFDNKDQAKEWLYERWGFILENKEKPSTYDELVYEFRNMDFRVVVESIEID